MCRGPVGGGQRIDTRDADDPVEVVEAMLDEPLPGGAAHSALYPRASPRRIPTNPGRADLIEGRRPDLELGEYRDGLVVLLGGDLDLAVLDADSRCPSRRRPGRFSSSRRTRTTRPRGKVTRPGGNQCHRGPVGRRDQDRGPMPGSDSRGPQGSGPSSRAGDDRPRSATRTRGAVEDWRSRVRIKPSGQEDRAADACHSAPRRTEPCRLTIGAGRSPRPFSPDEPSP